MEARRRGLRYLLQPILYVGLAAMLHALLFLIPGTGPAKRDSETTRGIRVKTYVEGPPAPAFPAPAPKTDFSVPSATAARDQSMSGKDTVVPGGRSGAEGGPAGTAGPSQGPTPGSGGPVSQSEYGQYLSRLRSEGVQGWARQSARASRQGWKGSGAGAPGSEGWGAGTGKGTGGGKGPGSGKAPGGSAGAVYMDPRVRMVVIQYPIDERGNAVVERGKNVENRYRQIQYPDHKVKKTQFTAGWWNVYVEIRTGRDGKAESFEVLRPETRGALETIFIDQVRRDVERWGLEAASEIHVDVRFYVE